MTQMRGCNRKRSVADSGQTSTQYVEGWTSRDVDEAEHIVVIWLQCLLDDVASHVIVL